MPAQRKLSPRQLELLLEFAENHSEVALGRAKGPQASQAARQSWKSMASVLNCVPEGTIKTPDQWRRYWIEFKARTKTKAADSRRHALSTGGGANKFVPLNKIEERVLAVIGQVAVAGLPEVRIPISIPTAEIASPTQPNPPNSEGIGLLTDVEGQERMRSPVLSLPPSSLTQRKNRHSRNPPHTSSQQRLRISRPIKRDPNVPRWAYELELKRIEAEDRRTAVAEKQVKVQHEMVSELKEIKLALQELTALIKEYKKT